MNIDHPTSGPIRDTSVYLPWQTRKAFGYLLLRESGGTIDGLIDGVLTEWLKANHPTIVQFIDEQQDREKQFRKSLEAKKPF